MVRDKFTPTIQHVVSTIIIVHGKNVIMDSDLALLYGVSTKRLNEQVKRNPDKFPDDFMFRLSAEEFRNLKSQIATSSTSWGGKRKPPNVFTEFGALQAANVLNSPEANKMSVFVVRAFLRMRNFALNNERMAGQVRRLESRVDRHDKILADIIHEIKKLLDLPEPNRKKRAIGFARKE